MKKILVVDDHVDAGDSFAYLLRLSNHEVRIVRTGEDALGSLAEFRPDVIFQDIGLPGIDGYAVAKAIRSRPEFDGVLLVALTGYGQPEDRKRARQAGFDVHLTKPASYAVVTNLLAR